MKFLHASVLVLITFLMLLLFTGLSYSQAYTAGPVPTCLPTAQNTHVMTWMDGPAVILQWCPGPNNTIDTWTAAWSPLNETCVTAAASPTPLATHQALWRCLAPPPAAGIETTLLTSRFVPRFLITRGQQPVVQISATGVVSPLLIGGVAQTVSGNEKPENTCVGPGLRTGVIGATQVLYTAAGRYSDQHQWLPGSTVLASEGITLPAAGLVWCYLTYPPASGWSR